MSIPRLVRPEGTARSALAERGDDELMMLARAGTRDAFEVLVERHAQRLVNLCARFLNDAQLGRDAAQDTWVLVWQRRASYRAEGRFLQWLITVARNHCRNEKRRDKAQPRAELVDRETPDSQVQIDRLLVEERRRRVQNALSELSPAMREALPSSLWRGVALRGDGVGGRRQRGDAALAGASRARHLEAEVGG
jgi:RNA polymerase sigma-70 factor (ECF subfamily)